MLRELTTIECIATAAAGVSTTSEVVYPTLYAGKEIIGFKVDYDTITWKEDGVFSTYYYSSQIPTITPIYAPITTNSF